jgi:hypothetical protein
VSIKGVNTAGVMGGSGSALAVEVAKVVGVAIGVYVNSKKIEQSARFDATGTPAPTPVTALAHRSLTQYGA